MASFDDIRNALATAVQDGTGLRSYPYGEAGDMSPPCAAVYRDDVDPRYVFGDGATHGFFKVRVYMPSLATSQAVRELDEYATATEGGQSVPLAVANEDNWPDDLIHHAQVQAIAGIQVGFLNGQQEQYLMQEFDVEVVW